MTLVWAMSGAQKYIDFINLDAYNNVIYCMIKKKDFKNLVRKIRFLSIITTIIAFKDCKKKLHDWINKLHMPDWLEFL